MRDGGLGYRYVPRYLRCPGLESEWDYSVSVPVRIIELEGECSWVDGWTGGCTSESNTYWEDLSPTLLYLLLYF